MGLINTTQQEYYDGNDFGNYQFISLTDIINQFMMVYVGEDKIIPRVKRVDVAFHAQRALAELSFDTFKSCKAQEITVPATLQMTLPQDYVNYTKISWVDSAGIKHLLYPISKTSNPTPTPILDAVKEFNLTATASISSINNFAVLDAEYKHIMVGMLVEGAGIPAGTYVGDTDNSGGITRVHLTDASLTGITQSLTTATGVKLTFKNADGSLVFERESIHIIEGLTTTSPDFNKQTATSAAAISEIKVGMIVSSANFPIGTVVTNVNEDEIFYSNNRISSSFISEFDGEITFMSPELKDSTSWSSYKSISPSENQEDYQDDTYWPADGERYGLDPQHAQANGSFYIDCQSGKIHFSSNISGKTVILDYISDSLGTDGEMQVHKFAEEAMYKCIAYAVLSASTYGQALIPRFKRERFAEIRKAKLRLSNIKLEEITQILRGKSKQIKH